MPVPCACMCLRVRCVAVCCAAVTSISPFPIPSLAYVRIPLCMRRITSIVSILYLLHILLCPFMSGGLISASVVGSLYICRASYLPFPEWPWISLFIPGPRPFFPPASVQQTTRIFRQPYYPRTSFFVRSLFLLSPTHTKNYPPSTPLSRSSKHSLSSFIAL